MAQHTLTEQTYALAALFQVAHCVNELAHRGQADTDDVSTLINSIFVEQADSTIDVYGHVVNLYTGLNTIIKQLDPGKQSGDMNIARIVITLLVLERKLAKRAAIMDRIYSGIERARQQATHFESNTHENVLANLASLYTDTISNMHPKVMVMGEQNHLINNDVVNRIRSLLLAGIRAAVLFRQLGGRRWQLLFRRNRYITSARQILAQPNFNH